MDTALIVEGKYPVIFSRGTLLYLILNNKRNIRDLLERYVLHDDKAAFRQFYELYYTKLINLSIILVKSKDAAKEVVSDVFYRILCKPTQLLISDNFDGYLFMMVKNLSLNYLRNNKRIIQKTIPLEQELFTIDESTPEQLLVDKELLTLVKMEVQKMPHKRQMIYILVKENKMKFKDVAELFDISVRTVEAHMYEATKSVRSAVHTYLEKKS